MERLPGKWCWNPFDPIQISISQVMSGEAVWLTKAATAYPGARLIQSIPRKIRSSGPTGFNVDSLQKKVQFQL